MSTNLAASAARAQDRGFGLLVQAAVSEYALKNPTDRLSRTLIRDPGFMGGMFVAALADNSVISAPNWSTDPHQQETDVRNALKAIWPVLSDAVPNTGGVV